ncbi:MAG: AAA family ATPase, partial [Thermoplasmata archaeon]|nr:AAA family ATPase [Thermoplasmata archaeon]
MRLVRLRMRNIRSYREAEVEFGDGITLFEGDIGSGKSTILLAIEFALFGLGDTDSAHLLRHGAKDGEVELHIRVSGRPVRLLRTLKRKVKTALVDKCVIDDDGNVSELTSADMKPRVLELLQFNENPDPKAKSDIFRFGVYTPQEDMRTILDTRGKMRDQRKETIRRALHIQEFRVARDNLKMVASEVNSRAREHRKMAEGIDDSKIKLERARGELEDERKSRGKAIGLLKDAEVTERETRKRRTALEDQERRITEMARRVEGCRTTVAKATSGLEVAKARLDSMAKELERRRAQTKRMEELEGVRTLLEEIEVAAAKVSELREAHQSALQKFTGLRAELKRCTDANESIDRFEEDLQAIIGKPEDRERLETELSRIEADMSEFERERTRAQTKLDQLKAELDEVSSLDGEAECPRCRQPLTAEHLEGLLERNRKENRKLTGEVRESASRYNRRGDRQKEVVDGLRDLAEGEKQRAILHEKIVQAKDEASREDGIRGQIAGLEVERKAQELEDARKELDEGRHRELLEQDAERKELLKQLDLTVDAESKVTAHEDRLHEAGILLEGASEELENAERDLTEARGVHDETALARTREEHDEANRTLGGLRNELRDREERIEMAESRVRERSEELAKLEARRKEVESHLELHRWLTQCIRPALERIELAVL